MTELKRCPFCGGEARLHGSYYDDDCSEYVSCTKCNAMTPLMDKKGASIIWWNRRSSNWHTGTPTEGGLYFVYDKYCGYAKRILKADISKEQLELAFHDVVAWQKITPYEGEEQFPCGCCKCYEDKRCILLDAEVSARTRDERCPLGKEKK